MIEAILRLCKELREHHTPKEGKPKLYLPPGVIAEVRRQINEGIATPTVRAIADVYEFVPTEEI